VAKTRGFWFGAVCVLAATAAARAAEAPLATAAVSTNDFRKEARQRYLAGKARQAETGQLFQKAADRGDALATMWVARLRWRGLAGFSQDRRQADASAREVIARVRQLAEGGDPDAEFLLGDAFMEGADLREMAPERQERAWPRCQRARWRRGSLPREVERIGATKGTRS
jgi:hypothetical protein